MANEEHLSQLTQGVEAWNQWRAVNRNVRPDLSKAYIAGDNLAGANFAGEPLWGLFRLGVTAQG